MNLQSKLEIWENKDKMEEECNKITFRLRQVQGVNSKLANANIQLANDIDADRNKFKQDTIARIEAEIVEENLRKDEKKEINITMSKEIK